MVQHASSSIICRPLLSFHIDVEAHDKNGRVYLSPASRVALTSSVASVEIFDHALPSSILRLSPSTHDFTCLERHPPTRLPRPSRTFLHGSLSRPRIVPFLFPAFLSVWTECVEDRIPWLRSVSFLSIRFHTTDRTRATRGRPISISSDHVLTVPPPKTDPIGSIGRSDEAKPRGRRRRFCTDDEDEDEMATRARVVRLPGVQACTRRVPAKVKAAVDAMEEPLWEGHAERMRMLLEREAREAMKRQVHRLDKVRVRTTRKARTEKKHAKFRKGSLETDGTNQTCREPRNMRKAP